MLTKEGYQVRKALSGQRALMTIEKSPPDLILLDVMMPDMDGYQVCQQLKSAEHTRSIPVIFISALDSVLDKVKAFEAGGLDYISKPFQELEVLARVRTHLKLQKQQNELEDKQRELEVKNSQLKQELVRRNSIELSIRLTQKKLQILFNHLIPNLISDRLKTKQLLTPQKFNSVTILCVNIVNIQELSQRIEPIEIVHYFEQVFVKLDRLSEDYGFDKFKIIGDAYMLVSGVPNSEEDRLHAIAQLALAMPKIVSEFKFNHNESFQMQIGIHTGSAIAGLLGEKQFIYDLWGETVEVAAAMESTAQPSKIQVTTEIYDRLKDRFILEQRGKIPIKGYDDMTTYWLIGEQSS